MTNINFTLNNTIGQATYVSEVDFEERRISSSFIANLFELGFSEREIEQKLLQKYDIDEFEDADIFSTVQKEVQNLLTMVKNRYFADTKEQTPQEAVLVGEEEQTGENNEIDITQITTSPLEEDFESWNIEDAQGLFSENISKEDFLFECDFLTQYNKLLTSTGEDNQIMQYLNGIQEIGAQNFFDALDADMNGILDVDELNTFISSDGDAKSISASEFNQVFDTAYNSLSQEKIEEATPIEKAKETLKQAKQRANSRRSGSSGSSSTVSTKVETLEDLKKQRQDIITSSDAEIEALNTQLETLVSTAPVDEQLKTTYLNAKEAFDLNQQQIIKKDEEIYNFDTQLHNLDSQIASLKGEYGALKTDTDNEETNATNAQRKIEIEKQIQALELQKQDIETQKQDAQRVKLELEELSNNSENGLKKQMDDAYNALSLALSSDVKTQIDSLKSQIEQAELNRTTKLAEIDAKIETKKAQDIQSSQKSGELKGKLASNDLGAMILETAKKYLGYNEADGSYKIFSTGDYGWCADFVTYVVKEVFGGLGYTKDQLRTLGSDFLGASPYKLRTKNKDHYYLTENIPQSSYESLVGMAFICKGSGASGEHTGFVLSVDPEKGTFTTLEGNSGNMVRTQERKISDMYGFVDFSYLYSA